MLRSNMSQNFNSKFVTQMKKQKRQIWQWIVSKCKLGFEFDPLSLLIQICHFHCSCSVTNLKLKFCDILDMSIMYFQTFFHIFWNILGGRFWGWVHRVHRFHGCTGYVMLFCAAWLVRAATRIWRHACSHPWSWVALGCSRCSFPTQSLTLPCRMSTFNLTEADYCSAGQPALTWLFRRPAPHGHGDAHVAIFRTSYNYLLEASLFHKYSAPANAIGLPAGICG